MSERDSQPTFPASNEQNTDSGYQVIDAPRLVAALRELAKAFVEGRSDRYGMRIPAEPYRDGDIVCGTAARLIERLLAGSRVETNDDEGWREHPDGRITVADITLRPDPRWDRDLENPQTQMRAAETTCSDGYKDAFYQIAELLDMAAMPISPKEAFETVMLPRLRKLTKAENAMERVVACIEPHERYGCRVIDGHTEEFWGAIFEGFSEKTNCSGDKP